MHRTARSHLEVLVPNPNRHGAISQAHLLIKAHDQSRPSLGGSNLFRERRICASQHPRWRKSCQHLISTKFSFSSTPSSRQPVSGRGPPNPVILLLKMNAGPQLPKERMMVLAGVYALDLSSMAENDKQTHNASK
jgi:hypothetical protein